MVTYKRKPDLEVPFREGLYKQPEIEELYELHLPRDERLPVREEKPREERVVREVQVKRQGMPRMEDQAVQPLKLLGPEVIGSLFERVQFLKTRIREITEALKLRESIHSQMVEEIDVDIKEKEAFATRVADIDEKRNFKLDVSILRKEKRLENVQYWRDVTELRSELREFLEKYETEGKIVAIFKGIAPDGGEQA